MKDYRKLGKGQKALVGFNSAAVGANVALNSWIRGGSVKKTVAKGIGAAVAAGLATRKSLKSYNRKKTGWRKKPGRSLSSRQAGWAIGIGSALGAPSGGLAYGAMKAYNMTVARKRALKKAQKAAATSNKGRKRGRK